MGSHIWKRAIYRSNPNAILLETTFFPQKRRVAHGCDTLFYRLIVKKSLKCAHFQDFSKSKGQEDFMLDEAAGHYVF